MFLLTLFITTLVWFMARCIYCRVINSILLGALWWRSMAPRVVTTHRHWHFNQWNYIHPKLGCQISWQSFSTDNQETWRHTIWNFIEIYFWDPMWQKTKSMVYVPPKCSSKICKISFHWSKATVRFIRPTRGRAGNIDQLSIGTAFDISLAGKRLITSQQSKQH